MIWNITLRLEVFIFFFLLYSVYNNNNNIRYLCNAKIYLWCCSRPECLAFSFRTHDDGPSTYFKHTLPAVQLLPWRRRRKRNLHKRKLVVPVFVFLRTVKTNLVSSSACASVHCTGRTTPFGVLVVRHNNVIDLHTGNNAHVMYT